MKKGWKITLIVLGSLIGFVLLLLVVAFVALKVMLTPDRLTGIVNDVSDKYVQCETRFERVELSLFETFPNVGLEVQEVYLVNPYQLPNPESGSTLMPLATRATQNDTLAHVGRLTLGVDVKAFLKKKQVVVHELCLSDVQANLYIAPDGKSNFDIFELEEDNDTTPSEFSLAAVDLTRISIKDLSAHYCDLQKQMLAEAEHLDLDLHGHWQEKEVKAELELNLQQVLLDMCDSTGAQTLCARLTGLGGKVNADGTFDNLEGRVKLTLPSANISLGDSDKRTVVITPVENLHDYLLAVSLPFKANIDERSVVLDKAKVALMGYEVSIDGRAALAHDAKPMEVDLTLAFDRWKVKELLANLPQQYTLPLKGMRLDGLVSVDAAVKGVVAEGRLPQVTARVKVDKGSFAAPKLLPMPLSRINADLEADLNLSTADGYKGPSKVKINSLGLKAENSSLKMNGAVDDLLGDMHVDANVSGNLNLPDFVSFLPDTMPMTLQGVSDVKVHVDTRLSALKKMDLRKVRANGTIGLKNLDVRYDSIHAVTPEMTVALRIPQSATLLPKSQSSGEKTLIGVDLKGRSLKVQMPALDASVEQPDIQVELPNLLDKKQPLAAVFAIACGKTQAAMDSTTVEVNQLSLKGRMCNDKSQTNVIKQWNPDVEVALGGAAVSLADLSDVVRMPSFKFRYTSEACELSDVDVRIGASDYHFYGRVHGLEDWLSHKDHLRGNLYFNSQYTDLDQLLDLLSGLGSDSDTIAKQRKEDKVPAEANPFIVPKDVNVTLYTKIDRCLAYGNYLDDLAGTVTIADGAAILDQMGFTCKAARMQLTGIYKSPRVNHLFAGLDFHLLDITVEELIAMVPTVDTLVPMLKAFKGKANFHLAAECNLNAFYKPKMSTLLGAAAISGENLVVMDNEKIADIAKLLQLKDWRNKDNNLTIDSLSVEATVFRKEVLVYPFALNLHNYTLCIDGRHTLDNACDYHFEIIKCPLPLKLAVNVTGTLGNPKISLGSVKYAELFKPEKKDAVQTRTLELKKMIRQALEANVR